MDELLTPEQVADWFQTSPSTLRNDRYLGRGPKFIKIGRQVRYRRSDVIDFIESNTHTRTDIKVAS